ncbi:MAG: hypothetical protein Q9195_006233 [Heterodermia aff. obscurata]
MTPEQVRKQKAIIRAQTLVVEKERIRKEAIAARKREDQNMVNNIGYFDPTMTCAHEGLYYTAWDFGHALQKCQKQYNYYDSTVIRLLPRCLRGPAFKWFNESPYKYAIFSHLSEVIIAIVKVFPAGCPIFETPSYTREDAASLDSAADAANDDSLLDASPSQSTRAATPSAVAPPATPRKVTPKTSPKPSRIPRPTSPLTPPPTPPLTSPAANQ